MGYHSFQLTAALYPRLLYSPCILPHISTSCYPQAASLGNQARIPLGVPKAALHLKAVLFEGQQGSVSQRELNGTPVAVKRARISTGQARKALLCPLLALMRLLDTPHAPSCDVMVAGHQEGI